MSYHPILLAAGIGDVVGVLLPIVFFVIYLLNQLISAKANPQQRGPQRRGTPQRPPSERSLRPPQPAGRGQVAGEVRGGSAQLNEEIEQFLKRAGQRREQPGRQRKPSQASRATPPRKPPAPQRPAPSEVPIDVVPLDEPPRESLAASVSRHFDSGLGKSSEHLADDIVHVDEAMQEHVQSVFEHRVGTLQSRTDDTYSQPVGESETTPAAALAQLLRTPQGMHNAVVLSEILARPDQRW